MNTLYHADVFFFVTTVMVVVLGILGIVAGVLIIRILVHLKYISKKARTEGGFILDQLSVASARIANRTFGFRMFYRFVRQIIDRYY